MSNFNSGSSPINTLRILTSINGYFSSFSPWLNSPSRGMASHTGFHTRFRWLAAHQSVVFSADWYSCFTIPSLPLAQLLTIFSILCRLFPVFYSQFRQIVCDIIHPPFPCPFFPSNFPCMAFFVPLLSSILSTCANLVFFLLSLLKYSLSK